MKLDITPLDLYRTSQGSAWRVETLQHYDVPGDEERQRAFHAGEPLPSPRQAKLDDLALIRQLDDSGREVGRVHLVRRPLSPYLLYELAVYEENVAAGENVQIADESVYPELAGLDQDFVISDPDSEHPAVILFDHDDNGRVLGYRADCSRDTVAVCREQLRLALSRSVPLADFKAAATL